MKKGFNFYTLQFLNNAIAILISYIEKKSDVEKYLFLIGELHDLQQEIGKEMDEHLRSNI